MALSDEQIQELLEWYVNSSETRKKFSEERKKACEENHQWVQPQVIQKMSDEELREKFEEYYKTGGKRQALNQIYRNRIIKNIELFRKTLLYLLNEEISIEERINQILAGKYQIKGFGRAILTSFLMDFNPDKYCLWNSKTELGFSVLGWEVYKSKDSPGIKYRRTLEALEKIRNLKPELNLTLDDIDLFLHTISAENEGREAVSKITGIANIPITETIEEVPEEGNVEFVMEKYLEDFIVTNFNNIKFDTKLKLYQDEESTGRQYLTPVGSIDLLAIDEKSKEFVVIELKKGKSSDVVVGQLLRYMGWVSEKLASPNGYKVRGIIIAKEKDEKLEYALKLLPNINLFLYEISFNIKKVI